MHKILTLCALAGALVVGCGQAKESADYAGSYQDVTLKNTASPTAGGHQPDERPRLANQPSQYEVLKPAATTQRAVIRSGSVAIRVDSVEAAEKKVAQIVAAANGYVATTTSSDLDGSSPMLKMDLRVDSRKFDQAMAALESLGVRMSKAVESEDVTAKLIDLNARLGIMSDQEQVMRKMLRSAGSQSEMLDLQQRIMNLRADIESLTAQRKSLSELASLSKISLTLQQGSAGAMAKGDPNWAQEAWGSAGATLKSIGQFFGTLAIWAILLIPVWVPLVWVGRVIYRSQRRSVA